MIQWHSHTTWKITLAKYVWVRLISPSFFFHQFHSRLPRRRSVCVSRAVESSNFSNCERSKSFVTMCVVAIKLVFYYRFDNNNGNNVWPASHRLCVWVCLCIEWKHFSFVSHTHRVLYIERNIFMMRTWLECKTFFNLIDVRYLTSAHTHIRTH